MVADLDRTHQPWALSDPHSHLQPWAPYDPHAHQLWAHATIVWQGMAMEEDGDFYDDGPGGYGPGGHRRGGGRYGGIGGGGGTMDDRRRYGGMMGGSMGGGDPYSGGPGGRYGGMEGGIRGGPYGGSYGEEMDFGMGGGDMMYDESLPLRRSGYGPPMMDGRMGPPPPFYRR